MLKKGALMLYGALTFSLVGPVYSQIVSDAYQYGSGAYSVSQSLYDVGLVRRAELNLIESLKKFPESPANDKSILLQAHIDLISGNYNVAIGKLTEFIKSRKNSPFVPYAEIQRGYIEFERKNYAQSEVYFASAQTAADKDAEARADSDYVNLAHNACYWRAVSIANQGKYQEAQPVFETVYKNYPKGPYADDALYAVASIYEVNHEYSSAVLKYKELQKTSPYGNDVLASYIREANDKILLRDPSGAIPALERAETIRMRIAKKDSIGLQYSDQSFSENAAENILYLRGEAYNLAGNYDQAILSFLKFLDEHKTSKLTGIVKLGLGWAYLNKSDYKSALLQYDDLILADKEEDSKIKASAQLYRAVALKRSGQTDQARKELSALAMQSAYAYPGLALLELSQMDYEAKDFVKARKNLERADREALEAKISVRVKLLLGAVYLELKLWDKSVAEYRKVEQLATNSSDILLPNKNWYISESRLKQGIALVQSVRSAEAIGPLLSFIGSNPNDPRNEEALFWLAEAYYRKDMLKNSIETYENLIDKYPNTSRREEALYGLGWANFRLKNFDKSSQEFDRMVKEFPKSAFAGEVLSRQGDGFYLIKNYAKAAEAYKKAVSFAAGTDEGLYAAYQLCHAYYRLGKFEQSITSLLDFVNRYPKSSFAPNALYLIGWIRFQQNKYAESIDGFKYMVGAYPTSVLTPRAYYAIADAYYNMGNFEEAIAGYKKVMQDFPSSELAPEAMKSVQFALTALGKEEEAIQIADQYIQTNPNSPYVPDLKYKKAEIFYTGRKYTDAVEEFKNFSKQFPNSDKNAEVLYWMGKSYINLNENDKAIDAFKELSKKFPKSDFAPQGLLEYGLLLKETAGPDKADAVLDELQKNYPKHQVAAQAGFERAMIKFGLGDTVNSLKIFAKTAEDFPTMDYGYQSTYKIAMYYRSVDMYDSARVHFDKLSKVADNPSIAAEAYYRIGELYMRQENVNKAVESFVIVKEKFSGYEDWFSLSLLNLGECYEKLNNIDGASEVYSTLEALRPEDDFGKTAKTRLKRLK